jgi:nucleotide-binding universal stress UspA family protein
MPKPIVVGVSPFEDDSAPLNLALALARATSAPLVAVAGYVHDAISNVVSGGTIEADLKAEATRRLEQLAGETGAELVVLGGSSPAHVLQETAVRWDAGMVVVGSTRKGPLGRMLPGTTAERLLHGAPCPVAVATAGLGADWAPQRIGVGFIDLESGHAGLRAAAELARAAGASLHAVTAIESTHWGSSAVVQPYDVDGRLDHAVDAARASLHEALERLPDDVEASSAVAAGNAAEVLVEISREVDLLVCGSRGYGPVRSVLLGGVTHHVIRTAHCPVVIVPRGAAHGPDATAERTEATMP